MNRIRILILFILSVRVIDLKKKHREEASLIRTVILMSGTTQHRFLLLALRGDCSLLMIDTGRAGRHLTNSGKLSIQTHEESSREKTSTVESFGVFSRWFVL